MQPFLMHPILVRPVIFALCLSMCLSTAFGQQVGTNANPNGAVATFSTTATLVVEAVTVKDKSGKPIEGLTEKDFTVTEDGVPQVIKFFHFESLPDTPNSTPTFTPRELADVQLMNKLPHAMISPEAPGTTKYSNRRLMALYFDMSAMPPPDQMRALSAAEKFIKTQMQAADLMAIMVYSGGAVLVHTDFTDDRAKLLSTLETLIVGEGQGLDENAADASSSDTGAAFGQDDSEFNLFNTDRQLSALQTAAKMLGTLNEKKQLIYFASGLRLNGVDNQAQLHATINSAIRAGVSFWPIDARGLTASAPLGDATKGSPGGREMYTGAAAMASASNFARSQDTLWSIAADTGGKALLDSNDLGRGIVDAEKAESSYYIVGYYATNDKPDGKFRRIKITVNAPGAQAAEYRQGYYANKVFAKFTTADKERQLEDAFMLGDPITELTIAMEVDYFQLNRAEYFVPVIMKIPGKELALARKGGAEHTMINFILEVKDEYGTTIQNVHDKVDTKLSDTTAAELMKRPIQYATGFTLLPGTYKVKLLARDDETGRIGTYEKKFVIPNLNKEEQRVPISSVVLSSQRIDLRDAIYNASKEKDKSELTNPLVVDGQKLIPSVTRVFSTSRDMYIYLQAYERGATAMQPLVAFVTFYKGQVKAFETPPLAVTEGMNDKSKAVPLRFSVSLTKLPPGEYNCQVTVLDPTGQKAAFWSAPVMLVQ
jgi:VWFA-related protein